VDEVVVCDGESTDGTIDVIKQMAAQTDRIKYTSYKQEEFRNRTVHNSHQYYNGFNEIERRNHAIEACSCDYILIKDVDELYEDNFYKIIEDNPNCPAFSCVLYEVVNQSHYFNDVRIVAKHAVPRFVKNNIVFTKGDNARADSGIDCIVSSKNNPGKSISQEGMAGCFDLWHYKVAANKTLRDIYMPNRKKFLVNLDSVPQEHIDFMDIITKINEKDVKVGGENYLM
jgi:glycosyltransferase involved in cell wall biosynthesis